MDVTPEAVRAVTFRGALRGYKVEDVDAFVEEVATGVAKLCEQLRYESARAAASERRAEDLQSQLRAAQMRPRGESPDAGGASA